MRSLLVVLVLVVGGCHEMPRSSRRAVPRTPAPSALPMPGGGGFVLPELAPDLALAIDVRGGFSSAPAHLEIAGVDTRHWWPMGAPPVAYRVAPGRWLLEDGARMELFLWDGEARQLAELGPGRTVAVPRLGRVISAVLGEDVAELSEVDLAARKLRVLHRGGGGLQVLGAWDGALVAGDVTPGAIDVVVLRAGQPARHLGVKGWMAEGPDAVRKGRLLVVAPTPSRGLALGQAPGFAAKIATLDLASGDLSAQGDAPGCEVLRNNIDPLIVFKVMWGPRVTTSVDLGDCTTWVDPPQ